MKEILARLLKAYGISACTSGLALFVILLMPLIGIVDKYPEIPDHFVPKDYQPIESVSELYQKDNEPYPEYFQRISSDIYKGVIQYWRPDTDIGAKYTRVSFWDNYLLWAYSYLPGHTHFKEFEFASPKRTLERGVGLCSQVSRMVYYILQDQGINARVISQPSHVIVQTNSGIIDSNYGVFLPYMPDEIRKNIHLVNQFYGEKPVIEKIFSNSWDSPENHDEIYEYMKKVENFAYILKYLIPCLLVATGCLTFFLARKITS